MTRVAFTEFRRNASGLLVRVERGEALVIMRHGRPVAELNPVGPPATRTPAWKKPGLKLALRGGGLAAAIKQERARANVL